MTEVSANAYKEKRPLSPHLQIYKPQMTSMLSILHRATGVALTIGSLLLIVVLVAAASGVEEYNFVMQHISAWYGQFALLGWSFALFYHMCNGVRHLIWDTGRLFNIKDATRAGFIVLLMASSLTAITWAYASHAEEFREEKFKKDVCSTLDEASGDREACLEGLRLMENNAKQDQESSDE